MKQTILIVDDEVSLRKALERYLGELGYHVLTAVSGAEALAHAAHERIDAALIDLVMGDMDGIECVRCLKMEQPNCVAIVITGYGTIATAVDAMKAGAYHYCTKPFELTDIGRLLATALEHRQLKLENRQLKKQLRQKSELTSLIGASDELRRIHTLIERVAETDSTVLILGESGTGKELVARAIHYQSDRAERPLVTVNCGAIPEDLLESELFGHMKGAFTGAVGTHEGKFEAANGGTIFLDEIGDMSLKLQVKILRVLQERRFEPVGSNTSIDIDVRIIAATNQDLERAVKERRFREDLYYRLHVIPVKLPSLRTRRVDIPLLIAHFVEQLCRANHRRVEGLSDEAMRAMVRYDWPGNVRELENMVERLVTLKGSGQIGLADLPAKLRGDEPSFKPPEMEIPEAGISFRKAVSEFENELILRALQKTGWNKNRAASLLKLNRTTLVEKIKKKHLDRSATS